MTQTIPKAIETLAYGRRFRSRTEARCAVFLTAMGLRWEYETEGFELPSGRYLPDFKVWDETQYSGFFWIECKAEQPKFEESNVPKEVRLARELSGATKASVLFFSGSSLDRIRNHYFWAREHFGRRHSARENINWWAVNTPYAPCSWQLWNRHSVVDSELSAARYTCFDVLMPFWPSGQAFKAANAALSARFEHGEVFQ